MENITLEAATLMNKLSSKIIDTYKKAGSNLEPGNYTVKEVVCVDGSVCRGEPTKTTPAFRMDSYYKALVLKYASMQEDPEAWLRSIMDIDGALGATVQLGSDVVINSIDADLVALHDQGVRLAKDKYQTVAKKVDRSGTTTAIGGLDAYETAKQLEK